MKLWTGAETQRVLRDCPTLGQGRKSVVGVTGLMVLELGEGGAISLAARANATVIAVVAPQPTLASAMITVFL